MKTVFYNSKSEFEYYLNECMGVAQRGEATQVITG